MSSLVMTAHKINFIEIGATTRSELLHARDLIADGWPDGRG
ncbi:hypothetical protein FB564_5072 [Salinispora arenicola]|uniref:Uncharacterized protein n=1 Tax=Salinispora arenicola TaxID=168697 RepID=A0A542XVE2_SALAC|nr:hypothetical protein FB564_5072 [Salinispora arenicola]